MYLFPRCEAWIARHIVILTYFNQLTIGKHKNVMTVRDPVCIRCAIGVGDYLGYYVILGNCTAQDLHQYFSILSIQTDSCRLSTIPVG